MSGTVIDPRQVALTALAVVGDLGGVCVDFVSGGGVLISVHRAGVPFMARLLGLAGLAVSDASETRHTVSRELVVFERTRLAHLNSGIAVNWYCEDGDASLADLTDYHRAISGRAP